MNKYWIEIKRHLNKLTYRNYLIYFAWKNKKEDISGKASMAIHGPRFTYKTYNYYKNRCRIDVCELGDAQFDNTTILIIDVIKL